MDEGRFRRDFLNQWPSSADPPEDLRQAKNRAAEISSRVLGGPVWRDLDEDTEAQWQSLVGPLSDDPTALGPCLLLIAKVLVDGIDSTPLKNYLDDAAKGNSASACWNDSRIASVERLPTLSRYVPSRSSDQRAESPISPEPVG
jgi:hypothetical protein